MPKVSVIIPIYGVEQYIERCARSLFEQTLNDMQFVFVNDCTVDNSINVLKNVIEDYPNRKKQIIIHNLSHNMGLHEVRKIGISLATGDYIAHCDSDDWVDIHMYEYMYKEAIDKNLDIVKCRYFKSDGKNHVLYPQCSRELNNKEELISCALSATEWNCIWDKIIKREIYTNDITYPQSYMFEDLVLSSQLIYYSNKIGEINLPLYFYFYNPGSICHTDDPMSYINRSYSANKNINIVIDFYKKKGLGVTYNEELLYLKYLVKLQMTKGVRTYKDYKYWDDIYPKIEKQVLLSRIVPLRGKIIFILFKLRLYHIYQAARKHLHNINLSI